MRQVAANGCKQKLSWLCWRFGLDWRFRWMNMLFMSKVLLRCDIWWWICCLHAQTIWDEWWCWSGVWFPTEAGHGYINTFAWILHVGINYNHNNMKHNVTETSIPPKVSIFKPIFSSILIWGTGGNTLGCWSIDVHHEHESTHEYESTCTWTWNMNQRAHEHASTCTWTCINVHMNMNQRAHEHASTCTWTWINVHTCTWTCIIHPTFYFRFHNFSNSLSSQLLISIILNHWVGPLYVN